MVETGGVIDLSLPRHLVSTPRPSSSESSYQLSDTHNADTQPDQLYPVDLSLKQQQQQKPMPSLPLPEVIMHQLAQKEWRCMCCSAILSSELALLYHYLLSHKSINGLPQIFQMPASFANSSIPEPSTELISLTFQPSANFHENQDEKLNNKWLCKFCCQRFTSDDSFNLHLIRSPACVAAMQVDRMPKDNLRHSCSFCSATFHRRDSALKHERRVHADLQDKKLFCAICMTPFTTTGGLSRHLNRLSKCRLDFYRRQQMSKSGAASSSTNNNDDDQPSSSANPPSLGGSIAYSSFVKGYPCSFCPAVFLLDHNRCKHERTFHPEKLAGVLPFCCEFCSLHFHNRHALNCHLRASVRCRNRRIELGVEKALPSDDEATSTAKKPKIQQVEQDHADN